MRPPGLKPGEEWAFPATFFPPSAKISAKSKRKKTMGTLLGVEMRFQPPYNNNDMSILDGTHFYTYYFGTFLCV